MPSIVEDAVASLAGRGIAGPVDAAIVLGTGLGRLVEALADPVTVPYAEIPGFPAAKVSGHEGRLVSGTLEGKRVLLFQGRAHYYETGDAAVMRVPIAVTAALKAGALILTNAAGSLTLDIRVGSIAAISDHINYAGINPLIGETGDERFVPMNDAYDSKLRLRLKAAARAAGLVLHEGVYMWFSGPSFETPAEIRMARSFGASLVGMSTVPEVILARRYGLRVAALSIITNLAAGLETTAPTHKGTRDAALASTMMLERLIRRFLADAEFV